MLTTKNMALAAALVFGALCGYQFFALQETKTSIDELIKSNETKDQQIAELKEAAQKKERTEADALAAKARMTPSQFGFYYAQGSNSTLQPLQVLSVVKQGLPSDTGYFTDKPQLTLKRAVVIHFVLYNRIFSMAAPATMFVHIIAKVKNDDGWFIRNRGYNAAVTPRADDKDILDVHMGFPPGRYTFEFQGRYYSFSIEGDDTDPNHCVEKKNTGFLNTLDFPVCQGGAPD